MRSLLPSAVTDLVSALSGLPSIGAKTARRLAFHFLETDPARARTLALALGRIHEEIAVCPECGFFSSPGELCSLCTDPHRSRDLCVVGRIQDVLVIEEAGVFSGRYHVLGGYLSPLDRVFPEDLRIDELVARVEREHADELIFAFDSTPDADYTAQFLLQALPPRVRITRIAAGIPFGGELEYTDRITLSHAFSLKREVSR